MKKGGLLHRPSKNRREGGPSSAPRALCYGLGDHPAREYEVFLPTETPFPVEKLQGALRFPPFGSKGHTLYFKKGKGFKSTGDTPFEVWRSERSLLGTLPFSNSQSTTDTPLITEGMNETESLEKSYLSTRDTPFEVRRPERSLLGILPFFDFQGQQRLP